MHDFNYHRPGSLAEAVTALQAAEEGKLLGGGQSLLPVLKLNLAAPTDLVAVTHLPELHGISRQGDSVVIGAAATHAEVASSEVVRGAIPGLATLAEGIGDPQVRNRGTLGGSVAHNDPAADYPAALLALGATVETDQRRIAAEDFFQAMFETPLGDNEIILAVHFPIPRAAAYAKFPNPASRYAVAGVMVAQTAEEVRVAVTGAGHRVFRVAAMEAALARSFTAAALEGIAVDASGLADDLDASAEYRAHLVGVMARRAVAACC